VRKGSRCHNGPGRRSSSLRSLSESASSVLKPEITIRLGVGLQVGGCGRCASALDLCSAWKPGTLPVDESESDYVRVSGFRRTVTASAGAH
jgi:hypothetical protein